MITDAKSFVTCIAETYEPLEMVFKEHVEDNFGEVLPHVLMADYCRAVLSFGPEALWVDKFLSRLEQSFSSIEDDEISNVISVSFIEHLPPPAINQGIIDRLGKKMKKQYKLVFGAT